MLKKKIAAALAAAMAVTAITATSAMAGNTTNFSFSIASPGMGMMGYQDSSIGAKLTVGDAIVQINSFSGSSILYYETSAGAQATTTRNYAGTGRIGLQYLSGYGGNFTDYRLRGGTTGAATASGYFIP